MPRNVDFDNRYSLVSVLGRGGLGVVYRAIDNFIPREVALKTGLNAHDPYSEHVIREAAIMALVDHSNVIPVYDAGYRKDSNAPFFVMKLVEGHDVRELSTELLKEEPIRGSKWRALLGAYVEVCKAIQHAHDIGVVHGDPKPSNVLVDKAGKPWLFDWGLSRVVNPQRLREFAGDWIDSTSESVRNVLFEQMLQGQAVGTPAFMSPEQARGEGIDEKTDVFVLGATLFHILTGQPPYSSEEIRGDFFEKIRFGQFALPRTINRAIPRRLETICMKAMAVNRDDRFDRASDIAVAVLSWLGR
jgi:serine/threonine protein kinase